MLSLNLFPFPTIETERLFLRQITLNDEDQIFLMRSNEKVNQFLDRDAPSSKKEVMDLIETIDLNWQKNESINWAISLKEDEKLIGTIGFWRIDKQHHRGEIGYMLLTNFQKKGIMQEALIAVLHYGFNKLALHSVEANVNPNNVSSINLLLRNKFIQEAYFKENYFYDGKFLDSAIFSLLTPYK